MPPDVQGPRCDTAKPAGNREAPAFPDVSPIAPSAFSFHSSPYPIPMSLPAPHTKPLTPEALAPDSVVKRQLSAISHSKSQWDPGLPPAPDDRAGQPSRPTCPSAWSSPTGSPCGLTSIRLVPMRATFTAAMSTTKTILDSSSQFLPGNPDLFFLQYPAGSLWGAM